MHQAKPDEYNSLNLSDAKDNESGFDSLAMKHQFQDSFDLSSFNLNTLSSEERLQEIQRCKGILKHYSRMMYLISSNSGWFNYSDRINFNFIANTLKLGPGAKTHFDADMGVCWSIKPLYGWSSDSIYPFTYRVKPYVVLMSALNAAACAFICFGNYFVGLDVPTFDMIWYANFMLNISVAFIDALAEGISAINTKLEQKIKTLKEVEKRETGNVLADEGEDNEMKAFGNFNLIRGLLRAVMGVFGGVTAETFSIQIAYMIMGIYPIVLILYTLFIFREASKRKWTAQISHIIKGVKALGKILIKPFILLPALYMYLNMTLPPSSGGTYDYLLVKKGGLSIAELSVIDNVASIIYYFIFLIVLNKMKGVALWKLFLIAGVANNFSYLLQFPFFFSESLHPWVLGGFRFTLGLFNSLAVDLLLMPMVGRISKYLPEGFESTGVVVVVSGLNFCSVIQGNLGGNQITKYGIKDGYYQRAMPVYVLNFAIQLGIYALSPLFLFKG